MGGTASPSRQKGPPASDIADWIRDRIRTGRLVPGQRLVEVDIIRQTGGSRAKVREAFQRLTVEGLVDIEEYRGASVRDASREEIQQLYRARAALEGICAADFALKASGEDRSKLRDLAASMEECLEHGAPEEFGRFNADWHTLIMEGSGNRLIRDAIARLNTPVVHLQFQTFYRGNRLQQANEDHRSIVDAVMAGDAEAAERAMRTHVENGFRFLQSIDRALYGEGGCGSSQKSRNT